MQREWIFIKEGRFVAEKAPARKILFFLYTSRLGGMVRYLLVRPWISKLVALYKKSSLSRWEVAPFIKEHAIKIHEYHVPHGGYSSFNDFFIRKLKPGFRPLAQSSEVIVSPADAKVSAYNVGEKKHFIIKDSTFSLASLLQDLRDEELFKDGQLLVFRLAPSDYHRFHLPHEGKPGEARFCGGILDSVQPLVFLTGRQPLITNQRAIIPVINEEKNFEYRFIPVGALCVGKIVCLYERARLHQRGEELGYFEFGGSTICLLFKKGDVVIEPSILENTAQGYETAVLMGEPVARLL